MNDTIEWLRSLKGNTGINNEDVDAAIKLLQEIENSRDMWEQAALAYEHKLKEMK